jgi:nitrogen fixation/metabolism regulation signal transduction histidine kinase
MKNKEIINRIEIHFGSQLKKDSQNLTHNGKIDLKKLLEESFECKISKSAFESLIGVKLTEKSKMQSDKVESPIYSEDEVDSFYDALANSTDKIIINHWKDEIIENDKWKIFEETSLNQENINEKSDSKYKTSPKTKKRKEDNGSQLHLNLSKPITQKDMERHQKYFERAVEYAAEKEKENDQNILFGMLIIIIVFLLIFGLTVASR